MNRRLYFLLQDASHAGAVVQELELQGIDRRQIHITAGSGMDADDPPRAVRQTGELGARVRKVLWLVNLAAFCMALLLFVVMLLLRSGWLWTLLPVGIMLISFFAGLGFTSRSPAVNPPGFRDTLRQGEVLMKVDVPVHQADRIREMVHLRHPVVAIGAVGWNRDQLTV
jgi:hypothetical protein